VVLAFFHAAALAAILPLFPRRLQLPIPLSLNLLLMPGARLSTRHTLARLTATMSASSIMNVSRR
jgi:hypothetical protein